MEFLRENVKYKLGSEQPYGYYWIFSKSPDVVGKLIIYLEDDFSFYETHTSKCLCVEVHRDGYAIEVQNGFALYCGKFQLSLYDVLSETEIDDGKISENGCVVPHFADNAFRVYKKDLRQEYLSDTRVTIHEQFIFSINSITFLSAFIKLNSFRVDNEIVNFTLGDRFNHALIFGEGNLPICHDIISPDRIKFFEQHKFLFAQTIIVIPPAFDLESTFIKSIQVKFSSSPCLPSHEENIKFNKVRERLTDILQQYVKLGISLDIDKEIEYFLLYPDLIDVVVPFLENQLKEFSRPANTDDFQSQFTFFITPTYDKVYYCIVKIAERAEKIEYDHECNMYCITFKKEEFEAISLMDSAIDRKRDFIQTANPSNFYDLYVIDEDVYKFILETDPLERLSFNINRFVQSEIPEKYYYSTVATNCVCLRIVKSIHKIKKQRVDELYAQMLKEHRVRSKWRNEALLYSIIKSLIPDALYQYSPSWLGNQTYDIFLPQNKIAIEYQGKQHYEAVEYFGGKEGLSNTIERDKRKREVSAEFGVQVLNWEYSTTVNEANVIEFLNSNRITYSKGNASDILDSDKHEILLKMAPPELPKPRTPKPRVYISSKEVRQYQLDGTYIAKFQSIKEAATATGASELSIRKAIYGERPTGYGFQWRSCLKTDAYSNIPAVIKQTNNTGVAMAVIQMDLNGNFIAEFPSKKAAQNATGVNIRGITDVINGVQKSAGGFKWKLK